MYIGICKRMLHKIMQLNSRTLCTLLKDLSFAHPKDTLKISFLFYEVTIRVNHPVQYLAICCSIERRTNRSRPV